MLKIVGEVPVKTRLPLKAWVVAGLVTLFSSVSTIMGGSTVTANSAMFSSVSTIMGGSTVTANSAIPGRQQGVHAQLVRIADPATAFVIISGANPLRR